jgi:hypothetical protein
MYLYLACVSGPHCQAAPAGCRTHPGIIWHGLFICVCYSWMYIFVMPPGLCRMLCDETIHGGMAAICGFCSLLQAVHPLPWSLTYMCTCHERGSLSSVHVVWILAPGQCLPMCCCTCCWGIINIVEQEQCLMASYCIYGQHY